MEQSGDRPAAGLPQDEGWQDAAERVQAALLELVQAGGVGSKGIIVIGCSTSEVAGRHIGTSGSEAVAASLYEGIRSAREQSPFYPAFQCCEHLNRALVIERELLDRMPLLEPVSVIPVAKAGGSMAAYAYRTMQDPVVVETIRADAAIDIGGTLIGMHLKPVAVPFRTAVRTIGQATLQAAYTRPKLIGGVRAVYVQEAADTALRCD